MTKKRYTDNPSDFEIGFSDWLRNNKKLDSSKGFRATNIDYYWDNWKSKNFILIEQKTYEGEVKFPQTEIFERIDKNQKHDKGYKGFFVLRFEKKGPDDSKYVIVEKLDKSFSKKLDIDQLTIFLDKIVN